MKCIFLRGQYMSICAADAKNYVPSGFEVEEYCETARHKICPLYMAAQGGMRGGLGRNPRADRVLEEQENR